jgi:hypothetical protein
VGSRERAEALTAVADAEDLRDFVALVREKVPAAQQVEVESSDQSYYGFVLKDVETPKGWLCDLDVGLLDEVRELVDERVLLGNLSWSGGLLQEDSRSGRVIVSLDELEKRITESGLLVA